MKFRGYNPKTDQRIARGIYRVRLADGTVYETDIRQGDEDKPFTWDGEWEGGRLSGHSRLFCAAHLAKLTLLVLGSVLCILLSCMVTV